MFTTSVQATRSSMFRRAFLFALAAAMAVGLPCLGRAQDQQAGTTTSSATVVRDPQGLAVVQSAVKALAGQTAITDVTLQAMASYVAGSDEETGTVTFIALGNMESRVLLSLSGGQHLEIRNLFAGTWSGPDGMVHLMTSQNCFTDASWFFPAMTLQAVLTDPQMAVAYLGTDASKGRALLHLQVARIVAGQPVSAYADFLRLSTMDFYLDPQSFLPLVLDFNIHPATNGIIDIPVEIQFGDYRDTNGALIPHRIQKLVVGTLTLDLTVSSVALNSGVPASEFVLPIAEGGQQ